MNGRVRWAAVLVAVLPLSCELSGPHAPEAIEPTDEARVGVELLETLRSSGSARVMIALEPPTSTGPATAPGSLDRMSREVGEIADEVLGRIGSEGFELIHRYATVPALAGTVHSEEALLRLATDPAVRRIDLDIGGSGGLAGSVSHIRAHLRHQEGNDGEGVVVAVLDTGIDATHPELVGALVHEACFGFSSTGGFCHNGSSRDTGSGSARDDAGHGTHVTGIVASRGSATAPGVAPAASIVAIKVMDNCSFSGCFSAFSEIVAALDYIIVNQETLNVQVINMSLGTGTLFQGTCDQSAAFNMAGSAAINTLMQMGVIAFAASMNGGSSTQMASPACLENVVAVGSVNRQDMVAASSNSNAATEILAPGVSIVSLAMGGGVRTASGTSMASPHAAGCAALLIQSGTATSPAAIRARLKNTGVPVTDPKNGLVHPRIDCAPDPSPPSPRVTVPVPRPGG